VRTEQVIYKSIFSLSKEKNVEEKIVKKMQRIEHESNEEEFDPLLQISSHYEDEEEEEDEEVEFEKPSSIAAHRRSRKPFFRNDRKMKHQHRLVVTFSIFLFLFLIYMVIFSNVRNYSRREVIGWARNASRETSDYVLPNENTTLIEPSDELCKSKLLLLVVVCSSANNFEARQTIRETWANVTRFNYPLFEKLHATSGNYLNINFKQWESYTMVSTTQIFHHEIYVVIFFLFAG
jgi:hypothetical protein